MNMDLNIYKGISSYCYKKLFKHLHQRHLEDCIQYVALKYFEKGNKGNYEWLLLDYLRENGLAGERSKASSRAIESATFVGIGNEDQEGQSYLLDHGIEQKFEDEKYNENESISEIFSEVLNLTSEVSEWLTRSYSPRIKSGCQRLLTKKKTLNILMKLLR